MADDTTRIINLTEATEVSDGMYLVTDASTGTRKLSLQKVLDKAGGNVADDYDATATYDVGDLCVYKGILYECSTEISTAEAWNPDHWSRINLGDIVADIDGSIEELYEDKANESGEYDDIVAGTAKQLLSSIYTANDSPYLYRPTPADSDRERVKRIEGLSVGWNQLCNASSVTVTSGHKYYMKKTSVESIGASDGTALTGLTSGTDMVIDLTILFGSSTIADHIYTLEQATEGSGVAWVKQYVDLDSYHAYSAPTIKSVEGLVSHDMVGFNQWDETTEKGYYDTTTGEKASSNNWTRSKDFIPVLPNTDYYCKVTIPSSGSFGAVLFYDGDKNFVSFISSSVQVANNVFTTPENARFMTLYSSASWFSEPVCINLSDPSRNGQYEPYEKHSYPLDSTITLRGIPKLVDGKLVADGDWYEPDGKQTVRFAEYTFTGNETWAMYTAWGSDHTAAFNYLPNAKGGAGSAIMANYQYATQDSILGGTVTGIWIRDDNHVFYVSDPYITDADKAKEKFPAGTKIVYAIITPTTSTASPYAEVEICDADGTEEFVTDSVVPVGNVTEYTADLRRQVENIYGIPPVPEEDGEYTLHATVAEGVKTFTWESEA